jgi:acyl carrier protein
MTHTPADYLAIVRTAVAESVGVDENEVEPTATLLGDLGAESIDLLDALFRIERLSGIKIQATDIADLVQGDLTDEEFEGSDGLVTTAGLDQLQKVLPSIDRAELEGKLAADDVMTLFTVQDLASMVAQRAGGTADAH